MVVLAQIRVPARASPRGRMGRAIARRRPCLDTPTRRAPHPRHPPPVHRLDRHRSQEHAIAHVAEDSTARATGPVRRVAHGRASVAAWLGALGQLSSARHPLPGRMSNTPSGHGGPRHCLLRPGVPPPARPAAPRGTGSRATCPRSGHGRRCSRAPAPTRRAVARAVAQDRSAVGAARDVRSPAGRPRSPGTGHMSSPPRSGDGCVASPDTRSTATGSGAPTPCARSMALLGVHRFTAKTDETAVRAGFVSFGSEIRVVRACGDTFDPGCHAAPSQTGLGAPGRRAGRPMWLVGRSGHAPIGDVATASSSSRTHGFTAKTDETPAPHQFRQFWQCFRVCAYVRTAPRRSCGHLPHPRVDEVAVRGAAGALFGVRLADPALRRQPLDGR